MRTVRWKIDDKLRKVAFAVGEKTYKPRKMMAQIYKKLETFTRRSQWSSSLSWGPQANDAALETLASVKPPT